MRRFCNNNQFRIVNDLFQLLIANQQLKVVQISYIYQIKLDMDWTSNYSDKNILFTRNLITSLVIQPYCI